MFDIGDFVVDRISGISALITGPATVRRRDDEEVECLPVRVTINGEPIDAFIAQRDIRSTWRPETAHRRTKADTKDTPILEPRIHQIEKPADRKGAPCGYTAEDMRLETQSRRLQRDLAAARVSLANRRIWREFYPDTAASANNGRDAVGAADVDDEEDWRPTFLRPIRVPTIESDDSEVVARPAQRVAWHPVILFPRQGVKLSDETNDEFTLVDVPAEEEPRELKVTPALLNAWHRWPVKRYG